MTDRELLELAAKAYGIKIEYLPAATRNKSGSLTKFEVTAWHGPFVVGAQEQESWNPLVDDGDALRLAVKLGLCISFIPVGETVQVFQRTEYAEAFNIHSEDMCDEGVRRAIVRAAAEIGKAMP